MPQDAAESPGMPQDAVQCPGMLWNACPQPSTSIPAGLGPGSEHPPEPRQPLPPGLAARQKRSAKVICSGVLLRPQGGSGGSRTLQHFKPHPSSAQVNTLRLPGKSSRPAALGLVVFFFKVLGNFAGLA